MNSFQKKKTAQGPVLCQVLSPGGHKSLSSKGSPLVEETEIKRKYYNTMQCNRALVQVRRGFLECREEEWPTGVGVGENRLASAACREWSVQDQEEGATSSER